MFVACKGIADLTGIEYFTELVMLLCHENNLTQLRLSKNTKLEVLYCHDNQLTDLRTENCDRLNTIHCYNNQLSDEAMKNVIANLPTNEAHGWLMFYYEGSPTEGNNIAMTRLNYLRNNKNWKCYFTKDNTEWLDLLAGDVNRDGQVTAADVAPLTDILLGKRAAPAIRVDDVNADYRFSIADITELINMITVE